MSMMNKAMSSRQHPLWMDQCSSTSETSLELEVGLPGPRSLNSLKPPNNPVAGIAHIVWLDVVDATLFWEGEGGSSAQENNENIVFRHF